MMERRQGTIDQHFRSKKRKLDSPVKSQVSKAIRDLTNEETNEEFSPKKGSLETFVVTSKRRNTSDGTKVLTTQLAEVSGVKVSSRASDSFENGVSSGAHCPDTNIYSNAPASPKTYKPAFEVRYVQGDSGVTEGDDKVEAAGKALAKPRQTSLESLDGDAGKSRRWTTASPDPTKVYSRRNHKAHTRAEDVKTPPLTQFASDFLSNYFSVICPAKPATCETASVPKSLKRRAEDLDLAYSSDQECPSQGLRVGNNTEWLQSEEKTESIVQQPMHAGKESSAEESEGQQDKQVSKKGEGSPTFSELVSLADSQSNGPSLDCESPLDTKLASELQIAVAKGSRNSAEVNYTLARLAGRGAKERADEEVRGMAAVQINTPIVTGKALDLSGNSESSRLHTPQTFAVQKWGPSPSNKLHASGGMYRSSLFSPGDDFWDEAIEVAGSLLASKIDVVGNTETRTSSPNFGQNDDALDKSVRSRDLPLSQDPGAGSKDQTLAAVLKLPVAERTTFRACNLSIRQNHEHMVKDAKDPCQDKNFMAGTILNVEERVKTLKLHTRSSEGFAKTVRDGRVGGWLKQLGAKAVSPLPVRHFDFSGSKEKHDPEVPFGSSKEKKVHVLTVAAEPPREYARVSNDELKATPLDALQAVRLVDDLEDPAVSSDSRLVADAKKLGLAATSLQAHHPKIVKRQEDGHSLKSAEILQPRADATTPKSAPARVIDEKLLQLSAWVPEEVAAVYAKKGLTYLYPWQMECLQISGVLEGKNLIYSASTSAGKSLVAEVLMIKRLITTGRIALFVLPFVSICTEKAEHLEAIMEPLGKRVGNFFGSQGSATLPRDTSVAVCTIEKANSLLNKLLEEGRLSEIAMIVIDELHMVGDRERGYLLELLLTKIRFACGEIDSIHDESPERVPLRSSPFQRNSSKDSKADLQIIGLSATMPNIAAVSQWLQAELYVTDFRPVPLEEFIKVGNSIYSKNMELVRTIRKGADCGGKDPDNVVELCHEVVKEGNSVLVFCSSRKACETSALHVAKYLPPFVPMERGGTSGFSSGAEAVEELRKSASGLDPVLAVTLPAGVAYHHAGLTMEEREVVEQCFKQGVVRVLTATSTLAAGVNLPARRVIFRQPKVGRDFLDGTRYRQMAGRAGRAGIDSKGESVLICKPEEVKRMTTVITTGCQPLQSCLTNDKIGMMRALLEVVAGGMVQTPQDVHRYVRCTLFNSTESFEHVVKGVQDALRWHCGKKFVEWNSETEIYSTTPLGRAAFGSSLTPEESLIVFEDLARAREGFVLASDLHLVYQVTPIYVELEPDWSLFYQKFVELSHLEQAVGKRVGVMEPFLMRMAHGAPIQLGGRSRGNGRSPKGRVGFMSPYNYGARQQSMESVLRVCRRFYVALMLSKLVQELPLMEVSDSFKVPRGTVQALQASAGRFAAMVTGFCQRLGWHDMEGLVSKFQSRVSFGVRSEIVELTEIPFVKGSRARGLYKAGLRTIQAVAEATMPELVKALSDATPWAAQDESRRMAQQRVLKGIARKIKYGAQRIVIDRAEEARIAAFSAMRALGVDVPPSLSVPLKMVSSSGIDEEPFERPTSETKIAQSEPVAELLQSSKTLQLQCSPVAKGAQTFEGSEAFPVVDPNVGDEVLVQDGHEQDNKENEGKSLEKEENNLKGRNMVSTANIEPIIQKFKEIAHIDNSSRLYGGVDMLKRRTPTKSSEGWQSANQKITSGPVDVDKMDGGFEGFLQIWMEVQEFIFDLNFRNHTSSSLVESFEIEGLAICWEASPVYYIQISNFLPSSSRQPGLSNPQDERSGVTYGGLNDIQTPDLRKQQQMQMARWNQIANIFSRKGVRKITWDLKNQFKAFQSPGISFSVSVLDHSKDGNFFRSKSGDHNFQNMPPIKLVEPYLDVRVAAWLLWPDEESTNFLTLEQEVKKRLPGEVAANASRAGRWANQMGRISHSGCCRRAAQTRALHSAFWKLLVSEGLNQPLSLIEMPLVKVLATMEFSGVGVDMEACCRTRQLLEERLKELERRAHRLAGLSFSLSLPADVANVLYKHLKLPIPAGCAIGKHHPSTNKQALDLLKEQHPVASVIQEHRKLSKLLHSTLGSIIIWAKSPGTPVSSKPIHQIFGRWLHTSTATGRLSMEEPNLQCVENTICLNDEQDQHGATSETVEIRARELFVPTQDGWVLLSADYSQIEVRLMAHFAEDAAMIDLLSRPSGDLFRMIAAQWTGQSEVTVTTKQREQTKRLVYGILYGMGVNTLAEHLDCSVPEASKYLDQFKAAFPGITSWLNQALINCRQRGYVTTLGGRKRYLEKINNGSYSEQARAGRQTANTICQGSAADLIKMAMVKLHSAIYEADSSLRADENSTVEENKSDVRRRCRLLLQIHDELVLEVDKTALREVSEAVRSCMEGVASLKGWEQLGSFEAVRKIVVG